MQPITINIENQNLQNKIINLSNHLNQPVEKICIEALTYFVNLYNFENTTQNDLKFNILDTEKFATKIAFEISEPNIDDELQLFTHIEDSAEYIHNLRKNNWRK